MSRLRRTVATVPVMGLLFTGVAMVSTAQAATPAPETLHCGDTITHSVTLASNVGPCSGDGLIVTASNIKVDLNGHTVFGVDTSNNRPGVTDPDTAGIRLANVQGVTVQNGTVRNFDAGVVVDGGSGNTVQTITAKNNINDKINLAVPSSFSNEVNCDLGDGITLMDSSNNRIQTNTADHNGPFSGISIVGNSDNNLVKFNTSVNNNVVDPNGTCGRSVQDIGIRIEGPGANGNRIDSNTVRNSALIGISLQGFVANPRPPGMATDPNTDNVITGNTVSQTGAETHTIDPLADGISIPQQGPATVVFPAFRNTITGNTVTNNFQDGIFVAARSHDNTINNNTVNNNDRDGIRLNGPRFNSDGSVAAPGAFDNKLTSNRGRGNAEFDGADLNFVPPCDNNMWKANQFGSVNQPCVAGNGGTGTVQQVNAMSASGAFGNTSAKTLSVNFTGPVTVTNPAGFTIYTTSDCSTPATGTGQSATVNPATPNTAVVTLNHAPNNTMAYKVAAGSVTSNGVPNAAVPCTAV